jgi:hypothetical protein
MLCDVKKNLKVYRDNRGVATFILNLSTTLPWGYFIPGKRAHGTHWIGGGMGQEANHGLPSPYPSHNTDYKRFVRFRRNEMSWTQTWFHVMQLSFVLQQPYILVFLLLYAFFVHPERGGSSFLWNSGSCLPKYVVSLLKISQCLGAFAPPHKCLSDDVLNPLQTTVHLSYIYLAHTLQ